MARQMATVIRPILPNPCPNPGSRQLIHSPHLALYANFFKNPLAPSRPAPHLPPRTPHGALAQLVEHLHGMQGVSGSNPLRSTFPFSLRAIRDCGKAEGEKPSGCVLKCALHFSNRSLFGNPARPSRVAFLRMETPTGRRGRSLTAVTNGNAPRCQSIPAAPPAIATTAATPR